MLVTIDQAKDHLRVIGADEDQLITLWIGAASDYVAAYLNRSIYEDDAALEAAADDTGIVINDAVKAAMLLTIGHLYANREENVSGTIVSSLPFGARGLLAPYRIGMGA